MNLLCLLGIHKKIKTTSKYYNDGTRQQTYITDYYKCTKCSKKFKWSWINPYYRLTENDYDDMMGSNVC